MRLLTAGSLVRVQQGEPLVKELLFVVPFSFVWKYDLPDGRIQSLKYGNLLLPCGEEEIQLIG